MNVPSSNSKLKNNEGVQEEDQRDQKEAPEEEDDEEKKLESGLSKLHTEFNELIWTINPFFKENIIRLSTFKFQCKTCKDHLVSTRWNSGFFENLETHLQSNTHLKHYGLQKEVMHNLIEEFRRFKKGEVEMEDVRKSNEIEKLVRFDYSLFLMKEGLPFNKIGPIIEFFQDLIKKYSVKDSS